MNTVRTTEYFLRNVIVAHRWIEALEEALNHRCTSPILLFHSL